jgi:hypothetical protein
MRSIYSIALLSALTLIGCGGDDDNTKNSDIQEIQEVRSEVQDNTAPSIVFFSSEKGLSEGKLYVAFSEKMDATTITLSNFTLTDSENNVFELEVSLSGTTAIIAPKVVLKEGVTYTLSVKKEVQDISSNFLFEAFSETFTFAKAVAEDTQVKVDEKIDEKPIEKDDTTEVVEKKEELSTTLSKVLATGQVTLKEGFDDGHYKAGIAHQYSRDDATGYVTDGVNQIMWQDSENSERNLIQGEAKNYCLNLVENGYFNWRLPTSNELERLVTRKQFGGFAFSDTFKTFSSNTALWSSDFYKIGSTLFSTRLENGAIKSLSSNPTKYNFSCVRETDKHTPVKALQRDGTKGVVTDPNTNLTWQDDNKTVEAKDWRSALKYCEALTLDEFSDWRLPNINELISIRVMQDDSTKASEFKQINSAFKNNDSLEEVVFNKDTYVNNRFWSSTSGNYSDGSAFYLNFDTGIVDQVTSNGFDNSNVIQFGIINYRCVRGGLK